ncbi:MAG: hypothetical protein HY505_02360 [Candidatus Yanofskybacteria bacterium]|nr:hypothetical protein [Candidatus Yanofskybacteria bacterium]
MSANRSEFRPTFERLAKTASILLETAYDAVNTLEHNIFDVLDRQIVNRLLSQYDKLVKAGFTNQEALDAVTNLVKRRLETSVQERRQS